MGLLTETLTRAELIMPGGQVVTTMWRPAR